jgi:hypothetical protein
MAAIAKKTSDELKKIRVLKIGGNWNNVVTI